MAIIDDMRYFAQRYETLANYVNAINNIMGYSTASVHNSIITCSCEKGWYVLRFAGECLDTFHVWDCGGLERAIATVDVMQDTIWRLRGAHRLVLGG